MKAAAKNRTQEICNETEFTLRPRNLWIEPTNACNISCTMCRDAPSRKIKLLSLETLEKVLEEVGGELRECHLYMGGESLLAGHEYMTRLVDKVRTLSSPKCVITLVTNGMLLDDFYLRLFHDKNVNLVFSIDASKKELFETIRRGTIFEVVMKNLEIAVDASISTTFYTSVQEANLNDLHNIVILAETLGIPEVCMGLVLLPGQYSIKWSIENLLIILMQSRSITELSCNVTFPKNIPGFSWEGNKYMKENLSSLSKECSLCRSSIAISTQGNIFSCFKKPLGLGNINNSGKLPSIRTRKKAAEIINGQKPPQSCYPCTWTGRGLDLIPNWKNLEQLVLSGKLDNSISQF